MIIRIIIIIIVIKTIIFIIIISLSRYATHMFNELVVNAALARRQDEFWFTKKGKDFWDRFVGDDGLPPGQASHGFPKNASFAGHAGLSNAADNSFPPSSTFFFSWFMSKAFAANPFYKQISDSWLDGWQ